MSEDLVPLKKLKDAAKTQKRQSLLGDLEGNRISSSIVAAHGCRVLAPDLTALPIDPPPHMALLDQQVRQEAVPTSQVNEALRLASAGGLPLGAPQRQQPRGDCDLFVPAPPEIPQFRRASDRCQK